LINHVFCFLVQNDGIESFESPQVDGNPKASDALSGELWEVKKERIRKASLYGKLPGWDLRSVSSAYGTMFLFQVLLIIEMVNVN
jgi:hypothetical protein